MRKIAYIFLAMLAVACSTDKDRDDAPKYWAPDGMGLMLIDVAVDDRVEQQVESRAAALYYLPEELVPTEDKLQLEFYQITYDENNKPERKLYKSYKSIAEYREQIASLNDMKEEVEDALEGDGSTDGGSTEGETTAPDDTTVGDDATAGDGSGDDVADLLQKTPFLPAGDYFARVHNGLKIETEDDKNAYFADSIEFTIVARDLFKTATMNVGLQNSIISLEVTDNFNKYFVGGASLKLTTESGAKIALDLPLETGYEQKMLYVMPDTPLYLEGTAIKQDPGTGSAPVVKFKKSRIGVASKSRLNCVVVDAAYAGSAKITVKINGEITTLEEQNLDLHD